MPKGATFYRFKQRRADGSVRDLEAYSSPVELNGRQMRYAIMHDVTERNAGEKALRQSEATLRRSQAVAHIGHWASDARQCARLLGRNKPYPWPGPDDGRDRFR